jgi:hypothetical protein
MLELINNLVDSFMEHVCIHADLEFSEARFDQPLEFHPVETMPTGVQMVLKFGMGFPREMVVDKVEHTLDGFLAAYLFNRPFQHFAYVPFVAIL